MELVFTHHAIKRIEERKISLKNVYECIFYPAKIEKIGEEFKYMKPINNGRHLLISVCVINQNKCTIVTVIDTSKVHKYL